MTWMDGVALGKYGPRVDTREPIRAIGTRPGQGVEGRMNYAGHAPNVHRWVAPYALSPWIFTVVDRYAESCKSAGLSVVRRDDHTADYPEHGLLDLLGPFGRPNDYQSTREFWALHHTYYELTGNAFWFWSRTGGGSGAPTGVHLLQPSRMRIVPGQQQHVQYYEYQVFGNLYRLSVDQVTHFKKPNPYNEYYGLPAVESLYKSVVADHHAIEWNRDFFADGVSIPVGMLVVPRTTSDPAMQKIRAEFEAMHGEGRRTAVVRADAGDTVWHSAGLKPLEMAFEQLRKLTRQEVYEAMGLPLGYLSEVSTEAHARVAERQWLYRVYERLNDVTDKINPEVMQFWPRWSTLAARFEDVRRQAADWDQQRHRYGAMAQFATANEMRVEFGLEKMEGADVPARNWGKQDRRDTGAVPQKGQIPDVVESGE